MWNTICCLNFWFFTHTMYFCFEIGKIKIVEKCENSLVSSKNSSIRFDTIFEKIEAKLGLWRYHDSALSIRPNGNQIIQFWPKNNKFLIGFDDLKKSKHVKFCVFLNTLLISNIWDPTPADLSREIAVVCIHKSEAYKQVKNHQKIQKTQLFH